MFLQRRSGYRCGDLTASDRADQDLPVRYAAEVGELIHYAVHMDWKSAIVFAVCLFTEQIEQLSIKHRRHEVKCLGSIGCNDEKSCIFLTEFIQVQFILFLLFISSCRRYLSIRCKKVVAVILDVRQTSPTVFSFACSSYPVAPATFFFSAAPRWLFAGNVRT